MTHRILLAVLLLISQISYVFSEELKLDVITEGKHLNVSWNSIVASEEYFLHYSDQPFVSEINIPYLDLGTSTVFDHDLSAGDSFYIAVSARSNNTTLALSRVEQFSIPADISQLTVMVSGHTVNLQWTSVPTATNYTLFYNQSKFTNTTLGINKIELGNTLSFFADLTVGDNFFVGIASVNGNIEGSLSNVENFTIEKILDKELNDSGAITCFSHKDTETSCPYNGQDGDYGRDISQNNDSDGHAGFSFSKLDNNGNILPHSATSWSCVKDNVTGLIWEVKTDDEGGRDKDWRYSWFNYTNTNNGGDTGTGNGGSCIDAVSCDTDKFTQLVNMNNLCGLNNWRMPSYKELINIINYGNNNPSIDVNYFPNTKASIYSYWSSSHSSELESAWSVNFEDGSSTISPKDETKYVRLVHTGQ
jgi:hypothetical protein